MKYLRISLVLISCFILILPDFCYAKNLSEEMNDFYDSLGSTVNVTDPQFINGQKAGYLSLGGIQYRSNIQNTQIASMQLPSMRAGCGGIDFFNGGMSYINDDQLRAMIKSIASNSPGLLMQMAIDQTSPQLGSVVKYFQNLARQVNDLNINSCEAAKTLLQGPGAVWQTGKTELCKVSGTVTNKFRDAAEANAKCNSGGMATETAKSASSVIKDQFPAGDINIAWKALKDSGFIETTNSSGIELAEIMMTLSGTIVIKDAADDNGEPQIDSFFPASKDDNVIKAMLEGGNFKGLKCQDTENCLNVINNNIIINSDKSYLGRVKLALTKIEEAIKTDNINKIDDNAYKLLSFSSLPLYKMLNVQAAYYPSSSEIGSISEYIAIDILYGFLEKENEIIRRASAKYDKESYQKIFGSWFAHQKEIKTELNARRQRLSAQFKDYYEMINRTATIEKMLSKDVSQKVGFGGKR